MGPSFAGGGPGAAHFARSGINNKTTKGVTGDLTRRGPKARRIIISFFIVIIDIVIRRPISGRAC